MKLKYYLRGMGIGIILTAIVMGFALGGRKSTLSDAEIITRAKSLGMVEGNTGVLSQAAEEGNNNENDSSSSGASLDKKREVLSQEVNQEVTDSGTPVSEVAQKEESGEQDVAQSVSDSSQSTSGASSQTADTNKTQEVVETIPLDQADSGSTEAVAEEATAHADAHENTEQANADSTENSSSAEASTVVPADNKTESDTSVTEATAAASTAPAAETQTVSGKTITIPGGLGSDQVAQILFKEGLVDNAVSFNRYLIDRGLDRRIHSGTKVIPSGSSFEQIASIITSS